MIIAILVIGSPVLDEQLCPEPPPFAEATAETKIELTLDLDGSGRARRSPPASVFLTTC